MKTLFQTIAVIVVLSIVFSLINCVSNDDDYTQSNPWDPNGDNFIYNQGP